jgi:hypothetical protein
MILNIKEEKNKKVYISEGQCGLLVEAKPRPGIRWFIKSVNGGRYDDKIYKKLSHRNWKFLLSKYVNYFPLSDEDKELLYTAMIDRYKVIVTCISNTSQVCKSIFEGMFDEDIERKDYSWFDNIEEIVDREVIKKYIEKRIEFGKKLRMFHGLPREINWYPKRNEGDVSLECIMSTNYLVKKDNDV